MRETESIMLHRPRFILMWTAILAFLTTARIPGPGITPFGIHPTIVTITVGTGRAVTGANLLMGLLGVWLTIKIPDLTSALSTIQGKNQKNSELFCRLIWGR